MELPARVERDSDDLTMVVDRARSHEIQRSCTGYQGVEIDELAALTQERPNDAERPVCRKADDLAGMVDAEADTVGIVIYLVLDLSLIHISCPADAQHRRPPR